MDREVLIEKYIQGTLNEKEQLEFDTLRGKDQSFEQEVQFHENLRQVIQAENDPVRAMVEEFESEATVSSSSTGVWKQLLVAASIFAVLGLAVFYNLTRPISGSDLYENYYESYPNVVQISTRGEEASEARQTFEAYENGKYEEALAGFSELYSNGGETYYLFYQANALLELGRAEEAIALLDEFSGSDDSLASRSGWYKAMAYLQLEDLPRAKIELEKVRREKAYNADKAEELLAELE